MKEKSYNPRSRGTRALPLGGRRGIYRTGHECRFRGSEVTPPQPVFRSQKGLIQVLGPSEEPCPRQFGQSSTGSLLNPNSLDNLFASSFFCQFRSALNRPILSPSRARKVRDSPLQGPPPLLRQALVNAIFMARKAASNPAAAAAANGAAPAPARRPGRFSGGRPKPPAV